jgi:hypothetical protein
MRLAAETSLAQATVPSGIMKGVFQQPARPPPWSALSSAKRRRMSGSASVTVGGSWQTLTIPRSRMLQPCHRRALLIAAQDVFV